MVNTREYNNKRFSIFESEEKTALELMNELGQACNEVLDRTDEVENLANDNKNKKVSYEDLHTKYQLTTNGTTANFNGSWQGLNKPTLSQEGAFAQVEKNMADIIEINEQLDTIAYNFDVDFPRLDGESSDNARFKRAITTLKHGDKLLFDNKIYEFDTEKIIINKQITIEGKKKPLFNGTNLVNGTVLKSVGFVIEENNIVIKNLGLNSPNVDNTFQANTRSVFDIKIKNCVAIAQAHCYLFESYNGSVYNVDVENCESYNAIHGFISKATNVNFINCKANNHTSYGFGNIADNIQNGSANNRNNRVLNCTSYTCGFGFICYSRDTKSTNNQNNIYLKSLIWSNCFAYDCGVNYFLGDTENEPSGQTYNYVSDVTIDNCQEIGGSSSKSIAIGRCNNSYINNFTFSTPVLYKYNLKPNVIITGNGNISINNNYPLSIQDIELTSSSLEFLSTSYEQTIRLTCSKFQELHSITTNNTNLRKLTLICNDDNVCIVNDESSVILSKKYFLKGSFVVLERKEDGKWYEVYGYTSFTG